MDTEDSRWAAWHLHLSALGAPATDQVVRHVVGAAVDAVREWDTETEWFFVRYWQFGPHVRFRVADLDTERQQDLDAVIRASMADILSAGSHTLTAEDYRRHAAPLAAAGEGGRPLDPGELWPAGVYRQPYRPEIDRYGGPNLLALSESLFFQASQLALAFIRLRPPEGARSGLGLRATRSALDVLADDDERLRFCRRAASGWQSWAEQAGAGEIPAPPPLAGLEGPAPGPVRRWSDQVSRAMTRWRGAMPEEAAARLLHAHIHMLHNRLGLSVGQECHHYLALASTLSTVSVGAVAP
ncbi:MAG: hypothetical protein QOE57_1126 [Acidimicrobiaceae bacterium]|nr:hypothetical protein [Acidimicrobiaceae bacterium]